MMLLMGLVRVDICVVEAYHYVKEDIMAISVVKFGNREWA